MALGKGMDADHDAEASLRRARSQGAVGAFSGDLHAGILVGLEGGINIGNEPTRGRISRAGSSGWNARGPSASTRRTTIRSLACALLNTFAGNNGQDARTADARQAPCGQRASVGEGAHPA